MRNFQPSVSVNNTYRGIHRNLLRTGSRVLGISTETVDQIDFHLHQHLSAYFEAPHWAQQNEENLHLNCGRMILRENPWCSYWIMREYFANVMRFHAMQRVGFGREFPAVTDCCPWPWANHPTYRILIWTPELREKGDPQGVRLPVGMYRAWIMKVIPEPDEVVGVDEVILDLLVTLPKAICSITYTLSEKDELRAKLSSDHVLLWVSRHRPSW